MHDPRPSFKELRKRHNITLQMLTEDAQIDPRAVILLDTQEIGTPDHVDQLLASLSRLTGCNYSRQAISIRDITFKLHPDYSIIAMEDIPELFKADQDELITPDSKEENSGYWNL